MTGRLTPLDEVPDITPEAQEQSVRYRLEGTRITAHGAAPTQTVDVTLTGVCAGPWCASLPRDGDERLYVLEGEIGQLSATIGPCQGTVHAIPDAEQTEALQRCLRNGKCSDADVAALEIRWN
jgi:hypothetical protein